MLITHEITFDFQTRGFMPWVQVVQDDSYSRAVRISLFDGGKNYVIPAGASAAVRYRKPDGTVGLYDTLPDVRPAYTIEGNVITVKLAPQMLTVAGEVLTDVVLISGQTALATFAFITNVNRSPVGKLESYNYFNLATVNMAYEQLYNAMDAARAEAVQAVPSAVDAWLQAHPEATTTVPDGSIGEEKLTAALREKLGGSGLSPLLVSQLKGFFRDMQLLLPQLAYTRTEHAGNAVMEDAAWVIRALEALEDGQVTPPAGGDDTHDHSYTVSVTREATCTGPGVRTYTCSCGHSYTQSIPATGHSYAGGVCSVCGEADPDAGEQVTYQVLNTLTHVTNSNNATTATGGNPYTAKLTADDGYEISVVNIMTGPDITSTNEYIKNVFQPNVPEGGSASNQVWFTGAKATDYGTAGYVIECKAGDKLYHTGSFPTSGPVTTPVMLSALPNAESIYDSSVSMGESLTANADGSYTATADGAVFFPVTFNSGSAIETNATKGITFDGNRYVTNGFRLTEGTLNVPSISGVLRITVSAREVTA